MGDTPPLLCRGYLLRCQPALLCVFTSARRSPSRQQAVSSLSSCKAEVSLCNPFQEFWKAQGIAL